MLPYRFVAANEFNHLRLQDEKTAIDPMLIVMRLLLEGYSPLLFNLQNAITHAGVNSRYGSEFAVPAVQLNQLGNMNVSDSIPISKAEGFVSNIRGKTLQSAACHHMLAGIHNRDFPRLGFGIHKRHPIVRQVEVN